MSPVPAGYEISTDPSRLDLSLMHRYLCEESYWAKGRTFEVVRTSVANSLNFGAYNVEGEMVGAARVVTDRATFAWLCDVFVVEGHRGNGLAVTPTASTPVSGSSRSQRARPAGWSASGRTRSTRAQSPERAHSVAGASLPGRPPPPAWRPAPPPTLVSLCMADLGPRVLLGTRVRCPGWGSGRDDPQRVGVPGDGRGHDSEMVAGSPPGGRPDSDH